MAPADDDLVSDVSDTARWVAVYRAIESARPDALFHDRLADRLAGERGKAILAAAPRQMRNGWWLVTRTKLIDDIIAEAIAAGCDRVINIAAGLDSRPYRLDVPAELTWIEADLPGLIADKERLLADETPQCRLRRYSVDMRDPNARKAFIDEALAGASKAFVLTEGLVTYLDDDEVADLSQAFTRPEIAWWTVDFSSEGIRKQTAKSADTLLANAPFKFAPQNGVAFFEDLGWQVVDLEPLLPAGRRFRRIPKWMRLFAALPQPDPRNVGNAPWSAVVRLTRKPQ
ncbi:class I SAM-dependent methyltransferase [Skermania sp. ID1734]|uniref:class I SAM-dependent methyltransferase n=1 Tax=Skermania sp. ID1734 TaxID=2597516 RepID=UPI00117E210F|nr:SAM-dependent methyltransferase [Skermania sp. ID1734]TSD95386.1 class I SAM-dependent methyltransferase [Skermania sp. ID1734]